MPDSSQYQVKIDNSEGNEIACLGISIGQKYHEKDIFKLIIEALVKANFKKLEIVIGDTLQRYTKKIENANLTDEEAYNQTKQAGETWLNDTAKESIQLLNENYVENKIYNWKESEREVEGELLKNYKEKYESLYKDNEDFLNLLTEAVDEFVAIKKREFKTIKHIQAKFFCEEYIKEEVIRLAAFLEHLSIKTGKKIAFFYPFEKSKISQIIKTLITMILPKNCNIILKNIDIIDKKALKDAEKAKKRKENQVRRTLVEKVKEVDKDSNLPNESNTTNADYFSNVSTTLRIVTDKKLSRSPSNEHDEVLVEKPSENITFPIHNNSNSSTVLPTQHTDYQAIMGVTMGMAELLFNRGYSAEKTVQLMALFAHSLTHPNKPNSQNEITINSSSLETTPNTGEHTPQTSQLRG